MSEAPKLPTEHLRTNPMLSVVIPVYNEVDSISVLLEELFVSLTRAYSNESWEVIVVDDGSNDGTSEALEALKLTFSDLVVISLKQNLGQTAALTFGFRASRGKVVVALDGDGQNDPNDIFRLVALLDAQDLDCVSGWRKNRSGDRGPRVWLSQVANFLIKRATGLSITDTGCTLKAYKGDAIRSIQLRGDMHRLIPFEIHLRGGVIAELPVNHRERIGGKSKYSLGRTFRVLQDIIAVFFIARFGARPMHLVGSVGVSLGVLGAVSLGTAAFLKLAGEKDFVESPLVVFGLVLITNGTLLVGIGLLAELVVRHAANPLHRDLAARE